MKSIKYLSSYFMINCKHIKQAVMKFLVAIVKFGIVFNILWLLQKLWTWSKGMNFVANLRWVWSLIPQYLAKTTFLVAGMSKFTSCLFLSFFYNFVEIYKVVLVLQWRRKFLRMMSFCWNLMRRVWRVWWSKRMVV